MYRWSSLLTIVFSVIQPALAQDFPAKPIRVIVGFPPGAGADMTARLAAQKLNATLVRGLNAADVRKRLADEGAEVVANSPAEFGDFFQKEITKWDGLFTVVAKPSL